VLLLLALCAPTNTYSSCAMLFRSLLVGALMLHGADAFGKKKQHKEGIDALREELDQEAQHVGVDATGGARDYELENLARARAGELNAAELGMENLKHAMKDPSALAEVAEMMKDPENMREVQKMMSNPEFQQQAKSMMAGMPDMAKMMQDPAMQAKMQQMMADPAVMQKAQAMAQAMGMTGGAGMGGAGMGGAGMGAAGGMQAEMARLQAENAALKSRMGGMGSMGI